MYPATVVNFKLKVQIVTDLLEKTFLINPLDLTLCQKPRMEKYEFPEKVPFRTSLLSMQWKLVKSLPSSQ